ncbi:MAG: class I SAM-dependent methyltransferase [Bdellovibrionaceae bacterium]|nr:class I SAM-dependent methyltransferase [Pseudobdellovibrionaceae bacterium]
MSDCELAENFVTMCVRASATESSRSLQDSGAASRQIQTRLHREAQQKISTLVARARSLAPQAFQAFINAAMARISTLVLAERMAHSSLLYRAFDALDDLFGIDYGRDRGMRIDPSQTERLYEGAGRGVQTSYESILIALADLAPRPHARMIDLGSGYGRVGLVVGLTRPDMDFIGYEYVCHRVEVSRACAERAGLTAQVKYHQQDLADPIFTIPPADIYYLFDPFTQDTYRHVFAQLKDLGRTRAVCVATKGFAQQWFAQAIDDANWEQPLVCDEGTLGIFRSIPSVSTTRGITST